MPHQRSRRESGPVRAGARALVTGGSSGIGLATASLLAARGCDVTVVGSNPGRVDAAATALGVKGRGMVCDFTDPAAVADLANLIAGMPAFDIVVHSAGIGMRAPAASDRPDAVEKLLRINVTAAIMLTAAALPAMTGRGSGAIGFVGSIAGAVGAAGEAAYAGSKAALAAYAASLRVELADTGVRVTIVVPGVVATDFFDRREVAYHRSRPKPVPPDRVARAMVDAMARRRDFVTVPGWLRVPIGLAALAPQWYGHLAARWGR